MSQIEFTVGILLCGKVREFLEECKWNGSKIEWREGRGWFERNWIIRGEPIDIQMIHGSLTRWIRENKLGENT